MGLFRPLKRIGNPFKFFIDLLLIVGIARHGHQSYQAHMIQFFLFCLGEKRIQLCWVKSKFGLFLGNVQLNQTGNNAIVFGRLFVDFL